MTDYPIHIGADALEQLGQVIAAGSWTQILVLTDTETAQHCYPHLVPHLPPHIQFTISPGEHAKNLDTCVELWQDMTEKKVDRKALMLNLGGGVIGDMGGFVAGTFKRGIDFVQVPTTLLSQVDASVGGKLGIDFQGYKNHIGLFAEPQGVYIWPGFLQTLSDRQLASGLAEVLKHHLIADGPAWEKLFPLKPLRQLPLEDLIRHSVDIKKEIVEEDPFEHGRRKALNFGHTIGHAIESHLLHSQAPLLHGEAIALGMIAEAWISAQRGLLSESALKQIEEVIQYYYPNVPPVAPADHDAILARTYNDKKNRGGKVLCTLLEGLGTASVNQSLQTEEILGSLGYVSE